MRSMLLAILFVGCSEAVPKPKQDPLVDRLAKLLEVASVTVHAAGSNVIVHIADWHFVPREHFAAELPDVVTEAEIDELYPEFLVSVDAFQREQTAILRALGVSEVWQDGRLNLRRSTGSLRRA